MSTSKLTIPPRELLWRTRGLNWEYCFLQTPEIDRGSWWRFYREVKAELSLSAAGDQVIGTLKDRAGKEHPYLASIFLDPVMVDAAGRQTEQFVVWFPAGPECLYFSCPADLAKVISSHFAALVRTKELKNLADDDEKTPEEVFQSLLPQAGPVEIELPATGSSSVRKIELSHRLDADLSVVEKPKRRGGVGTVIAILGLLITIVAVLYFGGFLHF